MHRVCIIILNYNGKEDTTACLQSLKDVRGADVIVIDNGSKDGSLPFLKERFPDITLLPTKYNLGFSGGNNVGIEYGLKLGYEYFLLLNNDTVVDASIVDAFLQQFEEHPEAGILGGKIYLMDDENRLDHFGGTWNPDTLDFAYYGYREIDDGRFDQPRTLDYVCGAAMMVKRKVFEEIGLFDTRFFLFWEETDLCFRARYGGFSVMTCPSARLWHKVSASFTGGKPQGNYYFWRNRFLWIERNFSGLTKALYLTKLFIQHAAPLLGKKLSRDAQILIKKLRKQDAAASYEKVRRYNAALLGIKDYLTRHFHAGSFQNKK